MMMLNKKLTFLLFSTGLIMIFNFAYDHKEKHAEAYSCLDLTPKITRIDLRITIPVVYKYIPTAQDYCGISEVDAALRGSFSYSLKQDPSNSTFWQYYFVPNYGYNPPPYPGTAAVNCIRWQAYPQ